MLSCRLKMAARVNLTGMVAVQPRPRKAARLDPGRAIRHDRAYWLATRSVARRPRSDKTNEQNRQMDITGNEGMKASGDYESSRLPSRTRLESTRFCG